MDVWTELGVANQGFESCSIIALTGEGPMEIRMGRLQPSGGPDDSLVAFGPDQGGDRDGEGARGWQPEVCPNGVRLDGAGARQVDGRGDQGDPG